METKTQPIIALFLIFIFFSNFPFSYSQSSQNIQTFYPFSLPPPGRSPPSPTNGTPPPQQPPPPAPPHEKKSSTKKAVAIAVATTAISTLLLSALLFFFIQKRTRKQIERRNRPNPFARDGRTVPTEFARFNNRIKGVVVDEDGLDVMYLKKLNGENARNKLTKQILKIGSMKKLEDKRVISGSERRRKELELQSQERPLIREKSSSSHQTWQTKDNEAIWKNPRTIVEKAPSFSFESIAISTPPPPPVSVAPPPPPVVAPKPPPPPPPKAASLALPPPQVAKGVSSSKEAMKEDEKVKLKPLHWDKVNPNVEHSMAWHKIEGGSFKFDDDLMEALFGSVAVNRKSPRSQPSPSGEKSNSPPTQIMILDPRKSQNTAIVLRSLAISRKEIIDALNEGQGLEVDTLEKLTKIAPTKEEESQILSYNEDPTRLADAESFLFHLLKKVPSAFIRFDTMLFRSTYDLEILNLRECLGTLEGACRELKTRGLFLKLLEAILKAGNRMNAGTSRGNAQAFNLSALRKLSDVKSTDGKTTLLHFVVEEVIRAEGKKCILNRNKSLNRSNSQNPENSQNNDEVEREYIKLGLPIVGGLSNEFSSVKKAASLDYDTLSSTSSVLSFRVDEIRRSLRQWGSGDEGGFVKKMNNFVEIVEMELKVVKEEQKKIMELVKNTREYYQVGSSKDKEKNPLQLFVIVKDFLGMLDKVCVEVTRNSQKKRSVTNKTESSLTRSSDTKNSVRFPILPANFMSSGSSSDSDDESKKEIKQ